MPSSWLTPLLCHVEAILANGIQTVNPDGDKRNGIGAARRGVSQSLPTQVAGTQSGSTHALEKKADRAPPAPSSAGKLRAKSGVRQSGSIRKKCDRYSRSSVAKLQLTKWIGLDRGKVIEVARIETLSDGNGADRNGGAIQRDRLAAGSQ